MRLSFPVRSPISRRAHLCATLLSLTVVIAVLAGGSSVTRLTDAGSNTIREHPAWSADASLIVFESESKGGSALQEIAADGSEQHPFVNAPGQQADADWSPDGKLVAFSSDVDGNSDICAVDPDGGNLQRLTDDSHADSKSRDGRLIAFASTRDGRPGIYVMNAGGSAPARVSPPGASDSDPVWRPVAR
jgi:TolB protein